MDFRLYDFFKVVRNMFLLAKYDYEMPSIFIEPIHVFKRGNIQIVKIFFVNELL